jgi:nicotinamide-nucleotide amidase
MSALAVAVLAEMRALGQTLATAESLTGGLLAATLVDVPGASAVYRGGLIPYATELKAVLVGVDRALLDQQGPVAADVAAALADGARLRCGADWGIGTTGVAGPDPQDGHPPGTVFVGVAGEGGATVEALRLTGDRSAVRGATVAAALASLAERIGLPGAREAGHRPGC